MTDAKDLKDDAEDLADQIQADAAKFGGPHGVLRLHTLPPSKVWLYGTGRDHEAAQKAVALLLERLESRLEVKDQIIVFDREDHSVWVILVHSPGKPIDEAKLDQLRREVGKAHDTANETE